MAIRSRPGVEKMPASGISSELSAHQVAPPGAIAHSRPRLCPRASTLSFSSLVSPLRPFGLGLLGRCDPRSLTYFFDVTDAGPASHRVRLWQGGPVHVLPFSSPGIAVYGDKFSSRSSTGSSRISQGPLASREVEERWQWRSLRSLALPSYYAVQQTLSLGSCAATVH